MIAALDKVPAECLASQMKDGTMLQLTDPDPVESTELKVLSCSCYTLILSLHPYPCSRVFTCRSHFTHNCWSIMRTPSVCCTCPLPSRDLALPAAQHSAILLRRVKWESAHGGSRPLRLRSGRFAAQRLPAEFGIDSAARSRKPRLQNYCSSRAARCVVDANQIRQITKRLQI